MKRFAVRLRLLALASLLPLSVHAAAPDPALLGCWRASRIALHSQDGTKAEDVSGRCTLEFRQDQELVSVCKTSTSTATTTYRYQIARSQVYAATMTGSTFKTDMVGTTREYEYRVNGDRLHTVTVPPSLAFAAAATAQKVETEGTRIACP